MLEPCSAGANCCLCPPRGDYRGGRQRLPRVGKRLRLGTRENKGATPPKAKANKQLRRQPLSILLLLFSLSSNANTSKPPTTADLYYSWDEKTTAKQENRKKSTVLQHGLTATAVYFFRFLLWRSVAICGGG